MEKTICNEPSCYNYGRYCRLHLSGVLNKPVAIKKESKERAVVNRKEYGPKSRQYVKDHPKCELNFKDVCTKKSQCVHHVRGKNSKEDLLNEKYWKASCFNCNTYVEQHDAEARAKGLKQSKFSSKAKNQKIGQ
jgi:hypothetical protein